MSLLAQGIQIPTPQPATAAQSDLLFLIGVFVWLAYITLQLRRLQVETVKARAETVKVEAEVKQTTVQTAIDLDKAADQTSLVSIQAAGQAVALLQAQVRQLIEDQARDRITIVQQGVELKTLQAKYETVSQELAVERQKNELLVQENLTQMRTIEGQALSINSLRREVGELKLALEQFTRSG